MPARPPNWKALHEEARQLEGEINKQLVAFSKLGRDVGRGDYNNGGRSGAKEPLLPDTTTTNGRFESMTLELQSLLSRLSGVNDDMNAALESDTSSDVRHKMSRHAAMLDEMQSEFTKTKHAIRGIREKAELLSSVRTNISSYRSEQQKVEDEYARERGHIDSSRNIANEGLETGLAALNALRTQKSMLEKVSGGLQGLAKKVPVLNNLMQKINTRKGRDKVILSGIVAVCLCFTIWYIFH